MLARGKLKDWTRPSHGVWDVGSSDVADDRTQRASGGWTNEGDGASRLQGGGKGRKGRRRFSGGTGIASNLNYETRKRVT